MTLSTTHTDSIDFTLPGVARRDATAVITVLQDRLNALNDLALTLKHVHWNVVGPHFIAVHTMLDPQVETVRAMVDQTAERIAALGGSPVGTPGALVAERSWDDYELGRADAIAHLGALDVVYDGILDSYRRALDATGDLDEVTQDLLVGHTRDLEQIHWMVRAHLETPGGELNTAAAHTEQQGATHAQR
ncbi:DNA-binding protein Dps [Gordonia hirsuta DSM 44140 = NBRC 16056]|uniref:DNA-binding protein Dps n=1 Tax=Gordonia hirsuta DSM 44140 = NBRC 16056 TaxID=1121927 RepID=L7L8D5_9ACTN|nr:DNA starvation/stationary phase protection protein [Gordonia hirsuta]GAC57184.1 DNA-binding protein Dps [Gordonia hirsuta DSM 44140 = NBRC 16056]